MKNVLIIGVGHMGEAILSSLTQNKDLSITILNRNIEKSLSLSKKYNCNYIEDKLEINENKYEYIFLCIRPNQIDHFFNNFIIKDLNDKLIISVLNAYSINDLKLKFGDNSNILRTMPNMNAKINMSTTAYVKYGKNNSLINQGINILKYFGKVYEINENQFSSFVALTGSAPAFIYSFIKSFKDFAKSNDYQINQSNEFIKETIIASTTQALSSEENIDDLISKITVPGGPTEAGIEELLNNNFNNILIKCFEKTKTKA
ncbi:pyrroline-5-carboxylate reductase family protein [Spiroplasma turonicum]|uniref:Pyrroline-5-carboxylate reductase n=1 Tax=Spiroplasma turonicum TaxID=216946 RepID=A0A0K1P6S4_9MOLU|nr:pyrroline-5-carboxylate reductase dimerization domain-containing protein [Spiroplasma turonicum]AKU80006.1 pyrroline-5-carboxylate reductase [Spiroplasma turonicum]ALX71008.1 pyrroline-5-carboxylate reductase [Spiroplasma turonicum]